MSFPNPFDPASYDWIGQLIGGVTFAVADEYGRPAVANAAVGIQTPPSDNPFLNATPLVGTTSANTWGPLGFAPKLTLDAGAYTWDHAIKPALDFTVGFAEKALIVAALAGGGYLLLTHEDH